MKCEKGYKKINNKCVNKKLAFAYKRPTKSNQKLLNLVIIFFASAFLGAVIEFIYRSLLNGNAIFYSQSLYLLFKVKLPFLPIYGVGGVLMVFIENLLDSEKTKFWARGLIIGSSLVLFELLSGLIASALFDHRLWDYSSHVINLGGIISLQISIMWIISAYAVTILYLWMKKNKGFKRFTQII